MTDNKILIFLLKYVLSSHNKKKILGNLSANEKAVLREFFIQNRYTIKLPLKNSTVTKLQKKKIIYRSERPGHGSPIGALYYFYISPEIRSQINSDMIDLPMRNLSKQEIDQLQDLRPAFIKKIEDFNQSMKPLY